ncbi:hypothetical protein P3T76_014995 [Phytophthora citrophthora]|uniref:Uncharacterized protein n=1 Tax=Phytophthora citrophthora TaxID=4793 RepID=A0AAD9G0A8_9STRA|nr:hypothetical protein P3T76_016414 [Phytophthora citrophthora]KAK1928124.1 hypothetical protein P3T76_016415 [Phytophthora citrophthora]KAK1929582.1 hypothetical protein P3T76_014980 [Phytophthora citrophthora]KAK1929584.1 hypothetical protein P3T76_014982 [Phytophthora citrophthora]KAK1929596.1 hypothetical protein P3T76_014994 [Phytophthora citrophthora]
MDIDGDGVTSGTAKPLGPSKTDHGSTNIETLTKQLEKVSVSQLAKEQKKAKKPKYIDTSKLLTFKRDSKRASSSA